MTCCTHPARSSSSAAASAIAGSYVAPSQPTARGRTVGVTRGREPPMRRYLIVARAQRGQFFTPWSPAISVNAIAPFDLDHVTFPDARGPSYKLRGQIREQVEQMRDQKAAWTPVAHGAETSSGGASDGQVRPAGLDWACYVPEWRAARRDRSSRGIVAADVTPSPVAIVTPLQSICTTSRLPSKRRTRLSPRRRWRRFSPRTPWTAQPSEGQLSPHHFDHIPADAYVANLPARERRIRVDEAGTLGQPSLLDHKRDVGLAAAISH